jgi:hypothetical protein
MAAAGPGAPPVQGLSVRQDDLQRGRQSSGLFQPLAVIRQQRRRHRIAKEARAHTVDHQQMYALQLGRTGGLLTEEGPASEGTQEARDLDLALGQGPCLGQCRCSAVAIGPFGHQMTTPSPHRRWHDNGVQQPPDRRDFDGRVRPPVTAAVRISPSICVSPQTCAVENDLCQQEQ